MTDPTQAPHLHRLAEFTGRGYDKGRGRLMCAAWALVAEPATAVPTHPRTGERNAKAAPVVARAAPTALV